MTGFGTGVKYGFNTVSSPTYLDPPKDIWIEAANVGAGDIFCAGSLDIILEKE